MRLFIFVSFIILFMAFLVGCGKSHKETVIVNGEPSSVICYEPNVADKCFVMVDGELVPISTLLPEPPIDQPVKEPKCNGRKCKD